MKENGSKTKKKAMEQRSFLMDASTRVIISMANLQAQERIFGLMDNAMMASGLTDSNMALACGVDTVGTLTKVNGSLTNLKAMGFTLFQMETIIKDSSNSA